MLSSTYLLLRIYILGLAVVSISLAQTITGSGSASGNLTVNATGLFFNTAGANTPANPLTPGNGSNTGSFAGLSSGVIHNLPDISVPGPVVIKSFATFVTSAGTIVFDLQSIALGVGTSDACSSSAVGSVCTPTGSPLNLIQVAPNAVDVFLTLNGLAYFATAGPGSAPTPVSLSIQTIMDGTIPAILPAIASAGGLRNSFSITIAPSS